MIISLGEMNGPSSQNSSDFDFVLVAFRNKLDTFELDCFIKNLYHLELIAGKDSSNDELIYYFLKAPDKLLYETAEKIKMKFPFKQNELFKEGLIKKGMRKIFFFNNLPDCVALEEQNNFFTMAYTEKLRDKFDNVEISKKDRITLIHEILARISFEVELEIDKVKLDKTYNSVDELIERKFLKNAFPLHDEIGDLNKNAESLNDREKLDKYWASFRNILVNQPLNLVRRYFGEEISIYFAWLGFYSKSLTFPSLLGILVLLFGIVTLNLDTPTNDICSPDRTNFTLCPICDQSTCETIALDQNCLYAKVYYVFDNYATIVFSLIISVWSVLFIEYWKRKQNFLQFEWDTYDLDDKIEPFRPEFRTKVKRQRVNKITNQNEPYFPSFFRFLRYFLSFTTLFFLGLVLFGFIFGIILYRVIIQILLYQSDDLQKFSNLIVPATAAIINFGIIIVFGFGYKKIAKWLNDFEYHEKESIYKDSLAIKVYLFEFVNTYGTLFYIAFLKGRNLNIKIDKYDLSEKCHPAGCLFDLTIQVFIFMSGKQLINNIFEIGIPLIKKWYSRKSNRVEKEANRWQKDNSLERWSSGSIFDEYQEMIIQFGFICMFAVSFPLAPLFSYINNIIEIRIDAKKFLRTMQRPVPRKEKDIRIWLPIIKGITRIAVITNGLIIAFTSEFVPRFMYQFFFRYANGTLDGYIEFAFSYKNLTDFGFVNVTNEICRYKDFREPYTSPDKYEYTRDFYIIFCARLIFVLIFEHFVFGLASLIDFIIPDVPTEVQELKDKENFEAQKAIWESKSNNECLRSLFRSTIEEIKLQDSV